MIRSSGRLSAVALFALGLAGPAAASVYPGCAPPPVAPPVNVHYVDPVNGSMSGDGTQSRPWHTLTEVVAAGLFYNTPLHGAPHINPAAPIQAGDTVYLLSGNHGPVTLQGWFGKTLVGYNNSDFITIAALPGQTPVLTKLSVVGGSKWVFQGLTVQSTNNTGTFPSGGSSVKDYWLVSLLGPHSDIIVDGAKLSSASDVSQWGLFDWLTKRASGITDNGGTCVALTNNSLSNVGFGLATQSSTNVLVSGNTINDFSDDGIDYGSNNLTISNNTITNSIEDGDGFHRDAMQGQPYNEQTVVDNIQIQNNTVIRLTDPTLKSPAYLQGIDAFDGTWTNINVSNNVVITDATQGISYYGASQLVIANNILLNDAGKVLPCSNKTFLQCQAMFVVNDMSTVPAIRVTHSKAGAPSANVAITANITTELAVDLSTVQPTIADNICLLTAGKCVLGIPINGKMLWAAKPGIYGSNNVISTLSPGQEFMQYDTLAMQYNLTLRPH